MDHRGPCVTGTVWAEAMGAPAGGTPSDTARAYVPNDANSSRGLSISAPQPLRISSRRDGQSIRIPSLIWLGISRRHTHQPTYGTRGILLCYDWARPGPPGHDQRGSTLQEAQAGWGEGRQLCAPSRRAMFCRLCTLVLGGHTPAPGRLELGDTSLIVLRDFPEPLAVATPPTAFQQDRSVMAQEVFLLVPLYSVDLCGYSFIPEFYWMCLPLSLSSLPRYHTSVWSHFP